MAATCRFRLALPTLALGLLAPAALGQSVLYTFNGDSPGDRLGAASGAGDVNGDGFADLIVGAPGDDNNGSDSGSARVFSGVDGSILYTFNGDSPGDLFGYSVSGAGDVDADGFDDVIVGALLDDNNGSDFGSARVFSGVDGSVIYTFNGNSPGGWFGGSVRGAGDVDGDGFADLIVGARRDSNNGMWSGSAWVFSGANGGVLYIGNGGLGDQFGYSVSGAGDVNGDGYDDLIVGAPGDDNNGTDSGSVLIFSGVDGSVLYTIGGDSPGDAFGYSVSGAGDVDGDGFGDLIVGAPFDDNNGTDSGSARVFSSGGGCVICTFYGDSPFDWFGSSVSGAGAVSGGGLAVLIVGAPGDDNNGDASGSARVFSWADGSVLYTLDGDSPGDAFGYSVSGAGAVSGGGGAGLIVGAPGDDNNGRGSGSARVFSSWSPVGTSYCGPAVPNSTGLPAAILALGSETITDDLLWLRATDLPIDKFGYFLTSQTQASPSTPPGSQGNLCLGGQIARFAKQSQNSGPSGTFTIQVDLTSIPTAPPHTVVAGETWNFQAWFRDNNPGQTSNFTDGVSVTFL